MWVCANFKKTLDLFSDNAVSGGDKENSLSDDDVPGPRRVIFKVLTSLQDSSSSAFEYLKSVSEMRHDYEALIYRLVKQQREKGGTSKSDNINRRKRRKKKKQTK